MNKYIIFHEFGRRKLTTEENYNTVFQNASKIIDMSNFASDESAKTIFNGQLETFRKSNQNY